MCGLIYAKNPPGRTVQSFITSHFNELIGAAVGIVTLLVMSLRLRREWRNRNQRPPDNE